MKEEVRGGGKERGQSRWCENEEVGDLCTCFVIKVFKNITAMNSRNEKKENQKIKKKVDKVS